MAFAGPVPLLFQNTFIHHDSHKQPKFFQNESIGCGVPILLKRNINEIEDELIVFVINVTFQQDWKPTPCNQTAVLSLFHASLQFHLLQVAGCVLGALVCAQLTGSSHPGLLAPAVGAGAVFGWEALMTVMLGITICGAGGTAAPVGIAAAVIAAVLAGRLLWQVDYRHTRLCPTATAANRE